mgnify:CR=1 FL=1
MIKTILKQVREYKAASILTPICMIFEVIMEVIIPYLTASIIDNGINNPDSTAGMKHIAVVGGIMIVVAALGLLAGMLGAKYGAKASTGLAKNLRETMYNNIQTFSFANIDKFSTAGLVTRLTTDVTNIQNAYQMILRMAMRSPFSIIFAMIMSFTISPKIALIYLVTMVVLAVILGLLMISASKYFTQAFPKYDDLNASVQENVSAIRVVKAYVREDHEDAKFKKASNNIYRLLVKAENVLVFNNPVLMLAIYTCILLISWMGANMIVSSNETLLTTGNLTNLLSYCMMILMNLMMLSFIFVMLAMSAASAKRIAEVIDEKPSIVNPENPVMNVSDGSVDFENVNFSYKNGGGDFVLQNINLHIDSGEFIGIIGGTGSSKTSLVNLISRLYDTTEGSVKVGGKDVREYDIATLRKQVSMVLQKNVLFAGSIYENLRWGDMQATDEECQKAAKLACADEFITKLPDGYDTHIEQGGTNVSGGQRQRLCIARALLKNPKILILDDSTSAVDTATDAKIRKSFAEEIPGTTRIIIAQRISSVMQADRIIVMNEGKISGIGTHEELLKNNEIYRDVYESQTGGGGDFDEKGGED